MRSEEHGSRTTFANVTKNVSTSCPSRIGHARAESEVRIMTPSKDPEKHRKRFWWWMKLAAYAAVKFVVESLAG